MATRKNKKKRQEKLPMSVVDVSEMDDRILDTDRFAFFANELKQMVSKRDKPGPIVKIVHSKLVALDFNRIVNNSPEKIRISIAILDKDPKSEGGMVSEGILTLEEAFENEPTFTALTVEKVVMDGIAEAEEHFTPGKVLFGWDEIPA